MSLKRELLQHISTAGLTINSCVSLFRYLLSCCTRVRWPGTTALLTVESTFGWCKLFLKRNDLYVNLNISDVLGRWEPFGLFHLSNSYKIPICRSMNRNLTTRTIEPLSCVQIPKKDSDDGRRQLFSQVRARFVSNGAPILGPRARGLLLTRP